MIAVGVVEMVGPDGAVLGHLTAGDQFGHVHLLWKKRNPVGYRAKSSVVAVTMEKDAYFAAWHDVYDSEEVKIVLFLRQLPLLQSLSLAEVLRLKTQLSRVELRRGCLKPAPEMKDDVWIIQNGECQLVSLKKSKKRPVANFGRNGAFANVGVNPPDETDLALLPLAETQILRCSLQWLKHHLPKVLKDLKKSLELMVRWSYAHIRKPKLMVEAEVEDDASWAIREEAWADDDDYSTSLLKTLDDDSVHSQITLDTPRSTKKPSRQKLRALPFLATLSPAKSLKPIPRALGPSSSSFDTNISDAEARRWVDLVLLCFFPRWLNLGTNRTGPKPGPKLRQLRSNEGALQLPKIPPRQGDNSIAKMLFKGNKQRRPLRGFGALSS